MNTPETDRLLSRRRFLAGSAVALGSVAAASTASASPLLKTSQLMRASQASANGPFTFYTWVSGTGEATFDQAVAGYNQTHNTNLSFDFNTISGSGAVLYVAKIKSLLEEHSPPALFTCWTHALEDPFIQAGAARPLGDWYAKYGWDKVLYPDAIKYTLYNGQPYTVPCGFFGITVWYHRSAFVKANVAPPTTFEELEKVNAAVLKSGTTPIALGALFGYDPMRWFEYFVEVTAGPTLHDKLLAYEASWNNSAVVEAFAIWKKWCDNQWFTPGWPGINPNDADTTFAGGRAAMDLQLATEEALLQEAGISEADFDLFLAPTDHTPARFSAFVQAFAVNPNLTPAQENAIGDFLNWFIQPAQQRKYYDFMGITATEGAIDPTKRPLSQKVFNLLANHPAWLVMDQDLGTQAMNIFFSLQLEVARGTTSPAEAAKQLQAAASKYGARL
jgi:raffinose/stachyose/melibiose transport system substrate-binding protein